MMKQPKIFFATLCVGFALAGCADSNSSARNTDSHAATTGDLGTARPTVYSGAPPDGAGVNTGGTTTMGGSSGSGSR